MAVLGCLRGFWVAQLVKNPPAMQETLDQLLGQKFPWRRDSLPTPVLLGFLVAQMVKNLPAIQETWIWSLGWEDPLKEGMAIHSSILAWRIPMDRGAWQATVHGLQRVRHDWAAKQSTGCLRLNFLSSVTVLFKLLVETHCSPLY